MILAIIDKLKAVPLLAIADFDRQQDHHAAMNDGILSVPAALVSIEPIEWQNTTSQHQRAPMRIQVRVLSDSMEAIEPVYSAVVEAMQPALHIRTEIKFSETSFYEYIGTFILNIVWKT